MTFPFIQTVLISTLEIVQFYLLSNKIKNKKLIITLDHISLIFLFAIMSAIGSYYVNGAYVYFINMIILIFFSNRIYRLKKEPLIFLCMISYVLLILIQLSIICCIHLFLRDFDYIFEVGILAQCIGVTLSYLIARFIPIHYLFEYIKSGNYIFKIVLLNMFLILSMCVVYWYLRFTVFLANMSFMLVIATIMLLMNLIFLKEGLKNHVIEEQNRAYQLYLPIVNELIDKIRLRQHDFNNHIASLKIVLDQQNIGKEPQIQVYLNTMENRFSHVDLLKMKRKIIAGFLYSVIKQAEEKDIELDVTIEDYEINTHLQDFEILEVLSILVNNAFETNVSENHVKIKFFLENGKSVLEVANKHKYIAVNDFNQFFKKNRSTKEGQGRGLGLYKLEKLLYAQKGEIEVFNSGDYENFIVSRITFPLIKDV